jgi:hypothetical protein
MPLRWVIDHPERFIQIVADGPVTLKEMEEHFDAIAVAEAMGYAKLFDASRLEPAYDDADVMAMGARLSTYTATMESGPLAVVGQSKRRSTPSVASSTSHRRSGRRNSSRPSTRRAPDWRPSRPPSGPRPAAILRRRRRSSVIGANLV